jgi:hypothetical protein
MRETSHIHGLVYPKQVLDHEEVDTDASQHLCKIRPNSASKRNCIRASQ